MRVILTLSFFLSMTMNVFSQDIQKSNLETQIQDNKYTFAYVSVQGKAFSKKLKVNVDFGDTPEQVQMSEVYSEILTNKKSFASVLNYMAENDYELVQTLEQTASYQGSGGTTGVVFIMKKKKS